MSQLQRTKRIGIPEQGSALIEYALVLILMLTFLFAIIDFARALYAYHFVANAAREATRFAIVRGTTWTASNQCGSDPAFPGGCEASTPDVQLYVQTQATGIGLNDPALIKATLAPLPSPNAGGADCSVGPPINPGCLAQVTVTYPFKFIMPFLPAPTPTPACNNESASICMTSTSEMVVTQ